MTTEEALIEISQIRSRQKKEQIGATRFELMKWTGRTLRDTLADLREMTDAGVVSCHPTVNAVFYKFTNKALLAQTANSQAMRTRNPKSETTFKQREAAERKSTQREEAEHAADRLTLLHQQQDDVLARMANCTTAEYPALAREYSRLQYSIERETADNEAAEWRKNAAARESRIVTNYGQFKLNK